MHGIDGRELETERSSVTAPAPYPTRLSATGAHQVKYANNWVILGIVVDLPAGGPAGAGPAGPQGHHVGLPAVAGRPHG